MSGPRPVRAPRGPELTCRGWEQEAALRMLMNNLDPEVAEDPDHLVVYGGTGRAARSWDAFDAIVRELRGARRRRDAARPVRQARRGRAHPSVGAAGPHRQLEPRRQVGDLGGLPRPRAARPDDVRPDDRGLVDLHRDPGHPAGHVRDLRRGRPPALRRHAARDRHADGGARRDGRRAAARGDHERRRRDRHRGRRGARPAASRHRVRRSADATTLPRRSPGRARRPPAGEAVSIALVGNAAEIEPALGRGRRAVRPRDRPDLGARPARRLRPGGDRARRRDRAPRAACPTSTSAARGASMAAHVRAMLEFQRAGAVVFDYGNNLRAVRPRTAGVEDAFEYPGFVPAFIRPQFCEGRGPFRWVALSGDPADILRTDRGGPRALPRRRRAAPLDRDGRGPRPVPGPAGADLLARLRRAGQGRARVQRARPDRRGRGADRHRAGPPRFGVGRVAEPRDRGDGRRLATPSPTGRSSTRWSTPRPARRGSRSTTAAASGSATRSTPGWSSSPTARRWPPRSWSAC